MEEFDRPLGFIPRFVMLGDMEIMLPEDAIGVRINGVSYDFSDDKLRLVRSHEGEL